MGFFDWLNPYFSAADAYMAGALPPAARVAVWAVLGAIVSMGLYWLFSPQKLIADLKLRIKASQEALDAHEGDLKDAFPLMGHSIGLALGQVVVILIPAVVASLPLLFLIAWMYAFHGYQFPNPPRAVPLKTVPAHFDADWKIGANRSHPEIVVRDAAHKPVADIAMKVPLPVVTKHRWWNVFFGDPNGYLPADGALKRIEIGLPRKTYLGFGPAWLRGWETVFFAVLIIVSLAIKFAFRIR